MSNFSSPWHSLKDGNWFKLICGASFQDLPSIRSLSLVYTLAGADCIDVAADLSVITAAREGIKIAQNFAKIAKEKGFFGKNFPWLMVSLNDGEDPHFRKAEFDPKYCPDDCFRPCEAICPAQAINSLGVIERRCYGCGRCLPVCPRQLITTRSSVASFSNITPLIQGGEIDALEIHTQVGHEADFRRLWQEIFPWTKYLKIIAISCQDHPQLIDYLRYVANLILPLPCPLIWQTDGRPMSGDIGKGTTHAAIKLAQKVLNAKLPGFVQLAGGTNAHTVLKLRAMGLLKMEENDIFNPSLTPSIQQDKKKEEKQNLTLTVAGIAYGSYARSLLSPILEQLDPKNVQNINQNQSFSHQLENNTSLLWQAVNQANTLVSPLKFSASQNQKSQLSKPKLT